MPGIMFMVCFGNSTFSAGLKRSDCANISAISSLEISSRVLCLSWPDVVGTSSDLVARVAGGAEGARARFLVFLRVGELRGGPTELDLTPDLRRLPWIMVVDWTSTVLLFAIILGRMSLFTGVNLPPRMRLVLGLRCGMRRILKNLRMVGVELVLRTRAWWGGKDFGEKGVD